MTITPQAVEAAIAAFDFPQTYFYNGTGFDPKDTLRRFATALAATSHIAPDAAAIQAEPVAWCVANPSGGVLIYGNGAVLKPGDNLYLSPAIAPEASELPPLPSSFTTIKRLDGSDCDAFTPSQMQAYARAAIAMHRTTPVGRAALDEFISKVCAGKSELIACAESAFYWFNKCARAAAAKPSRGSITDDAEFLRLLTEVEIAPKFSRELSDASAALVAFINTNLAAAEPVPTSDEWAEAQRVCDLPLVDEAIRGLIEDQTGDNATCLVREIMRATKPAPTVLASEAVGVRKVLEDCERLLRSCSMTKGPAYTGLVRLLATPAANEAVGVRETIYQSIRSHLMTNMHFSEEDGGGNYQLVDLMTPDGQSIGEGEEEMRYLAERIAESLATPAAPTDAKPLGLTFDGYHDSDEHFGKTILDLVRSRLDTDPDDLAEGDVFYVSACWVQPQEWRVVQSGNPFEVERTSPPSNPGAPTDAGVRDKALEEAAQHWSDNGYHNTANKIREYAALKSSPQAPKQEGGA